MSIKLGGKTPPLYSHYYNMSTKVERNNEGAWMGWNFTVGKTLKPQDSIVQQAREAALNFKETSLKLTTKADEPY